MSKATVTLERKQAAMRKRHKCGAILGSKPRGRPKRIVTLYVCKCGFMSAHGESANRHTHETQHTVTIQLEGA